MDGPNDRMDNYRHTHLDKIRKKKHSHMIKKEKMGQVKPRLQFQYHAKLVHQNFTSHIVKLWAISLGPYNWEPKASWLLKI